MNQILLELDLGENVEDALRHEQANQEITLADFLYAYPARFEESPPQEYMKLPLSVFLFQPVIIKKGEGVLVGGDGGKLRDVLDGLWNAETAREPVSAPCREEPASYPKEISDNEAVRIAYHHEMKAIADFLEHGLSVLVVCDKMLTDFIYEFVCGQAGKKIVLDTDQPGGAKQGVATQMQQALQGGPSNPLAVLSFLVHNLKPGEVLVMRSLDLLDNPQMIEILYQRTGGGPKPQLLAFLDPSLEVKKVLSDRFAVHISIMGLPRRVALDDKNPVYTVTRLLTRDERACFREYDPEGLYKHVAGLNAIQFRNAMQYVGATVERGCDSNEIYRRIRHFKTSSNDEIEIPDTDFEDIGGYDTVKQQLKRAIALMSGPIEGVSEKQRGQLIPRGFIFHGPPGTGKTLFAKAIANEMNATIQMVSGPEIMDKYVGQSENNLRRIFATARRNAPAVVFFDEFDSIASQRSTYSDGGARANNAVVAQFLTELDGFREEQAVLIVGTTNRIDIIDEALLRPSRLRPVEIGLPDYAARKRVAEIHARNFGVDKLLKNLCVLATGYLAEWEASSETEDKREIPQGFLDALSGEHPPYKIRYDAEDQRTGFLRGLQEFFIFVRDTRESGGGGSPQTALLDEMNDRLVKMGERYGLDLSRDDLPDLNAEEAEAWLMPMKADIRDLFAMLLQERRREKGDTQGGLTPDTFLSAVIDLVAEYTISFNNDEIRAVFQEASMEHHMEGQLVTPRYLGQKIGLIRKRRDEREAVHLSGRRGTR